MSVEGRLEITLHKKEEQIEKVNIVSSRPLQMASFFHGKTPEETIALMPSLYSICGIAQTSVALEACEQALGLEVSDQTRSTRQMAVWAETAREHITRIAIDWGEPVASPLIKEIMPLAQNIKKALGNVFVLGGNAATDETFVETQISTLENYLEKAVFGEKLMDWLQRSDKSDLEDWFFNDLTQAANLIEKVSLQGWQEVGGGKPIEPLPEFDAHELFESLNNPKFVARPVWDNIPQETTALTRCADNQLIRDIQKHHGSGLLTRLTALLVELANIPSQMRRLLEGEAIPQITLNKPGNGLSQIEAARGRLVHGVQIDDGKITDYKILAPTEWNFHPQGCAAKALKNLKADNDEILLEQAKLVVCAIDPCVAFNLRIA
ncbi:MAG: nickel-dependent hydrogenase large subunit [Rhodospirillales bacterium]|nr:nickel-dependent hydrogenase large subunit [Rhodospirillales bacterium]